MFRDYTIYACLKYSVTAKYRGKFSENTDQEIRNVKSIPFLQWNCSFSLKIKSYLVAKEYMSLLNSR